MSFVLSEKINKEALNRLKTICNLTSPEPYRLNSNRYIFFRYNSSNNNFGVLIDSQTARVDANSGECEYDTLNALQVHLLSSEIKTLNKMLGEISTADFEIVKRAIINRYKGSKPV